jgi:hypothetical protein
VNFFILQFNQQDLFQDQVASRSAVLASLVIVAGLTNGSSRIKASLIRVMIAECRNVD